MGNQISMIFKTYIGTLLLIQNETSEKVASSLRRNKNDKSQFPFQTLIWLPPLAGCFKTDFDHGLSLGSTPRIYTNSMFFLVFKVKYCNMQLPLPGISHPLF